MTGERALTENGRQRYARTSLDDERVVTVELAVLEIWCARHHLSTSYSAVSLLIKGKRKEVCVLSFFILLSYIILYFYYEI